MTIYYVSLHSGHCGLTTDPKRTLREEGTANVKSITKATAEQIEWVRAMGGHVPTKAKGGE